MVCMFLCTFCCDDVTVFRKEAHLKGLSGC